MRLLSSPVASRAVERASPLTGPMIRNLLPTQPSARARLRGEPHPIRLREAPGPPSAKSILGDFQNRHRAPEKSWLSRRLTHNMWEFRRESGASMTP